MVEEKSPRETGKEYGTAGNEQLRRKKAEREELLKKYYYPPGATEPVLREEVEDAADNQGTAEAGE